MLQFDWYILLCWWVECNFAHLQLMWFQRFTSTFVCVCRDLFLFSFLFQSLPYFNSTVQLTFLIFERLAVQYNCAKTGTRWERIRLLQWKRRKKLKKKTFVLHQLCWSEMSGNIHVETMVGKTLWNRLRVEEEKKWIVWNNWQSSRCEYVQSMWTIAIARTQFRNRINGNCFQIIVVSVVIINRQKHKQTHPPI